MYDNAFTSAGLFVVKEAYPTEAEAHEVPHVELCFNTYLQQGTWLLRVQRARLKVDASSWMRLWDCRRRYLNETGVKTSGDSPFYGG